RSASRTGSLAGRKRRFEIDKGGRNVARRRDEQAVGRAFGRPEIGRQSAVAVLYPRRKAIGSSVSRVIGTARRSIVAVDFFAAFVALLGLDRQRRDRPCIEALERNRLAGLLAVAVGALVDALQGSVD